MDARDRLRRFLEQRRELGESEFVLDGLPVDDVLKMVGARAPAAARAGGEASRPARAPQPQPQPQPPEASSGSAPPDYSYDAPAPRGNPSQDAAPPNPSAPREPERRFSAGASTDWREALRNVGAGRPGDTAAKGPPLPARAEGGAEQPVTVAGAGATPAPRAGGSGADDATPRAPVFATASLPPWLEALGLPAGFEAGRLRVADFAPEVAALPSLDDIAAHVAGCTACALYKIARYPVPGEGNPQAEFFCVGEPPSETEDEQGRPFVGEAGQLLTKILGAIQLTRDDVYLGNVLKHRPPGKRDPLPDEVLACQPYLLRQIELVRPKVILALGRFAAQTLLQTTAGIGALRGKVHRYHGVPLIVTYDPAALLRNEQWKRPAWEDVKLARRVLDAARAANSGTE